MTEAAIVIAEGKEDLNEGIGLLSRVCRISPTPPPPPVSPLVFPSAAWQAEILGQPALPEG